MLWRGRFGAIAAQELSHEGKGLHELIGVDLVMMLSTVEESEGAGDVGACTPSGC